LCTITAGTTAGRDPQYMGLGPYYAISALLEETGVDLGMLNVWR
ncbi:MAG: acetyl-CoA C-acyltransferase, partial [Lachnospiraceae bacterium]|nr:acetyl-CoA C-acyltransferase [Candidatus Hippenecus merdae]